MSLRFLVCAAGQQHLQLASKRGSSRRYKPSSAQNCTEDAFTTQPGSPSAGCEQRPPPRGHPKGTGRGVGLLLSGRCGPGRPCGVSVGSHRAPTPAPRAGEDVCPHMSPCGLAASGGPQSEPHDAGGSRLSLVNCTAQ